MTNAPIGIREKVEGAEQELLWIFQSLRSGTWFRRLVFLLVGLAFINPLTLRSLPVISQWLPDWYGVSYWWTAAILALAVIVAGARTQITRPAPLSLSSSIAVRGLLPFNADDRELFAELQREVEIRRVLASLSDSGFRFGILVGPSGVGKTSFLRAGVLAGLRQKSIQATYVELSNEDPLTSIQREAARHGEVMSGVLLLDQFEQFFLHQRSAEQRKPLIDALQRWYERDSGVRVFISIRDEDFSQMLEIQESLDYQLSNQNCFKLTKFLPDQAAKVLEVLCQRGDIAFDSAFVRKTVDQEFCDLEDGLVSPVNLAIVILVLANGRGAFTAESFRAYGGIDGLLESWLDSQLEAARYQRMEDAVIRTLTTLCDFDHNRRAGILSADAIVDKLGGDVTRAEVDRAVAWLAGRDVRLAVRVERTAFVGYQLSHERLIPAMRKAAGKLLTDAARANELLDRRVREWVDNERSSRFLLRPLEYWRVARQRRYLIWGEVRADKELLLNRSRARARRYVMVPTLAIVFSSAFYLAWRTNMVQRRYIEWKLAHMAESDPSEMSLQALIRLGEWDRATNITNKGYGYGANVIENMTRVGLVTNDQKLVSQALRAIGNLEPVTRADVLLRLVVDMESAGDLNRARELLDPAIHAAGSIDSHSSLMWNLIEGGARAGLAHKDQELVERILQVAKALDPSSRSTALRQVPSEMVKAGIANHDENLVQEGLQLTGELLPAELENELRQIAGQIPPSGLPGEASRLAQQVTQLSGRLEPQQRFDLLRQMARSMADANDAGKARELLNQARELSREIDPAFQSERERQLALDTAMVGLKDEDRQMLDQALQAVGRLDPINRDLALRGIIPEMASAGLAKKNQDLLGQAFRAAAGVDVRHRGQILQSITLVIAKAPTATTDRKLLAQLLSMVKGLYVEDRPAVLAAIAPYMAQIGLASKRRDVLDNALQISAQLDRNARPSVLQSIALQMTATALAGKDQKLFQDALRIAESLDPYMRSDALQSIIWKMLFGEQQSVAMGSGQARDPKLYDDALKIAEKIDPYKRSQAFQLILGQMLSQGLVNKNENLVINALQTSEKLSASDRTNVLTNIIPQMLSFGLENKDQKLVEEAQRAAVKLEQPARSTVLAGFIRALINYAVTNKAQQRLEEALKLCENLVSAERPNALAAVAVAMKELGQISRGKDLLDQAWSEATSIRRGNPNYVPITEIAADMAKLGYLKRAREIAESEGAPERVVNALAAVVLADFDASHSSRQ